MRDVQDLPPHLLNEIENFFLTYKKLESKVVVSDGWQDGEKARAYLLNSLVETD